MTPRVEALLVALIALGAAAGVGVVIATLAGHTLVGLTIAAGVQAIAVLVGVAMGAMVPAPRGAQPSARAASRRVTNA